MDQEPNGPEMPKPNETEEQFMAATEDLAERIDNYAARWIIPHLEMKTNRKQAAIGLGDGFITASQQLGFSAGEIVMVLALLMQTELHCLHRNVQLKVGGMDLDPQ